MTRHSATSDIDRTLFSERMEGATLPCIGGPA